MRRLELSAAARADIADIWSYSEARWGRAQADRYTDDINRELTRLADGLSVGDRARIRRYRSISVASHFIFYREEGEIIRVARILHARMDVARHLPD